MSMTSSLKCPQKAIIFAKAKESNDLNNRYSLLESQVFNLQAYCKKQNFEIIHQFCIVEGSVCDDQKFFYQLIDFIKKQKAPVVLVVDSVNILQRNFKEVPILEELRLSGKLEIHFLKEKQVLNKNSDSMQFLSYQMFVLMAKAHINSISDNVKRVLKSKLQNGEWIGKAPFGYKNVTLENGRKHIIIDEINSLIVKEIFNLYSTGNYSISKIAKKFNLSIQVVSKILKNPFYCGNMSINDKIYPHKYQTFVTKELFNECQK